MNTNKPLLVTGSHRSGTTWVGKMLASSPFLAYIHEPFNIKWHRPGICSAKFPYWFTYVTRQNEEDFYEPLNNTLSFRYDLIEEIKALTNIRDTARMIRDYTKFLVYRFQNYRPLIKDPIALFSAEWLASRFNMDVIILIRHPAAFAHSIIRKNWKFEFNNFLEQPLLMRDILYPFESEIQEFTKINHDLMDQAALLWKIIHYAISIYQNNHKDWIFIRHEDLSQDPLDGFKTIFDKLELEFSENVKYVINKFSNSSNPIESDPTKSFYKDISRNSQAITTNWKNSFSSSEIKNLRNKVEMISHVFYSDKEW